MNNLTKKEILLIHYMVMGDHGDNQIGVKSADEFESIFGRAYSGFYQSTFEKACCVYHSIARGHIFYNGNRRTALTVFLVLLELNNLELEIDEKFLEDFTVIIAHEEKYGGDDAVTAIVDELSPYLK